MGCALTRYLFLLVVLAGVSRSVLAQEVDMTRSGQPVYIESVPVDDERRRDDWVGQLGLGLIMSPDFLGGGAHDFNLRADVRFTYKDTFFLENNKFGAVLTSRRFLRAGVIGRIQGGRRDDLVRRGLSEADDIDDTFELGVFAGTSLYKLFLSAEAYWGVSGGSRGMNLEIEAGYLFELNSEFKLVPLLGVSVGSRDYMKAYFGVPAGHEQYAPYKPDGGIYDVHAELSLEQRLAKDWLLKGSVRLSKLKDNAFASPFAREDRVQARAFAGVVWLF